MDTQMQNFIRASIEKENSARLKWYLNDYEAPGNGSSDELRRYYRNKVAQGMIAPNDLMDGLPKVGTQPASRHGRGKTILYHDNLLEKADKLEGKKMTSLMMEAPESEKQLLYQGSSHEGKGRSHYLKERRQKAPEEKYNLPMSTNWEYGWQFSSVMTKDDLKQPAHGRKMAVHDSFYSRTGVPGLPADY